MLADEIETGFEPVSGAQIDDETREQVLKRLKERLGITEPITGKRFRVRLDQLIVDDEEQIGKTSRSMAAAFELVAMLHNPAIVPADEPNLYKVIAGSRRVIGMRKDHAPDTIIDVTLFRDLDAVKRALMTLVENHSRGDAWRRDLKQLVYIVQTGVAVTEREIGVLLNIAPSTAHELLKLTGLPEIVLERCYSGECPQTLAKKIARLDRTGQDKIAEAISGGEKLTKELVDDAMRSAVARQFAAFEAYAGDSEAQDDESTDTPPTSRFGSESVTDAPGDHLDWLRELAISPSVSARARAAASILLGELS
jgi:hypothetical protein